MIDELNALFKPLDENQSLEAATKLLKDPTFVDKSLSAWTAARFKTLPDFT